MYLKGWNVSRPDEKSPQMSSVGHGHTEEGDCLQTKPLSASAATTGVQEEDEASLRLLLLQEATIFPWHIVPSLRTVLPNACPSVGPASCG